MLSTGTIDCEAVAALARRVVAFFTEPYTRLRREAGKLVEEPTYSQVLSMACPIVQESVSVFDFSTRECLREAGMPNAQGQLLLPIGDALQEPFWPEGLGINRGIHNALDACWSANKWAMAPTAAERDDVLAERQSLYRDFTAPLNGKNRRDFLRPDTPELVYFADPESRYINFKDHDRALHEYSRGARATRQQRQRAVRDRERSRSPRR